MAVFGIKVPLSSGFLDHAFLMDLAFKQSASDCICSAAHPSTWFNAGPAEPRWVR